ncbi:MAG: acyltransferase [Alistipes sp.]|nr:acyltransferase [Alistipes sp.]
MKKINWLLILQGWTMLWVVIGHAPLRIEGIVPEFAALLYDIAYSFHMPLFILISGYLFYTTRLSASSTKWSYKAIMMDKLKRLAIPFIVFTIIAMGMKSLLPGEMNRAASFTFQEFFLAILYPREGPLLEMWFIAVILWMFALTPYWRVCLKSRWLTIATLTILLALHIWVDYLPLDTFLCLKDCAYYGIYFFIGLLASKYGFDDKYKPMKYLIIAVGATLYLCLWNTDILFGLAMSGIAISVGLAFILDSIYPKAFSTFRDYTYQIFLIGIFAQIAVKIIYKYILSMGLGASHPTLVYIVFYLTCIALGLYIPVVISKVAKYINWSPILLCLGLKKDSNLAQ